MPASAAEQIDFREQTLCWALPSESGGVRWLGAPRREVCMWLGIAIAFLIAWLIVYLGFHVVTAAIHILLALFVIFLIVHFVRRAASHA